MFIVLVHRPELEENIPPYERGPFDTIEILGVFMDVSSANAEIDKHIDNGKGWHFHIDETRYSEERL